jgi:hypothetical protein
MNPDNGLGPPKEGVPAHDREPALSPEKSTTTTQKTSNQSTVRCRNCSRPLHAQLSVSRCEGPTCWRRNHGHAVAA